MPTRRDFLAAAAFSAASPLAAAQRKFTIAFTPGSIGVQADQRRAIDLAAKYGYESVQPFGGDLAKMSDGELRELQAELKQKGLQWAAAGMPVDFRGDEAKFQDGLRELPAQAKVYERAGVTRISTWLPPLHNELTYPQNLRLTGRRLRMLAKIAGDHGMKFGLEYVGTPNLRVRKGYPFVHSMAETKELLAEAGGDNLGFVLDSWHWWTAEESAADILTLRADDIVSADLNDAPAGLALIDQQDNQRELPATTGVIPLGEFLGALAAIGYDGPVRPEPFNKKLNAMDDEPAAQAAATAMKKAFALVA
ncbi:MAG: sugar phosphate isomerase/epimerase [Acidobacteria bacterium]|nr:sugar phosphate isomerase/epimerase [Acidobacteriota bacterium]